MIEFSFYLQFLIIKTEELFVLHIIGYFCKMQYRKNVYYNIENELNYYY